ncbi:MAG: MucBP domain-containing protein [Lachnospiraceae bacterium]|nr:MucBP domain-containing protein [Lachnospiraceae bacterium]
MRVGKRVLRLLLLSLLLLTLSVPAKAAEEGYTYTIRIYAGQQGTVGGGEVMVYEGLSYEDRVTFHMNEVVLHDGSKYYVRGLRESGRDNNTVMENASFTVTGDRDYVVAYGLLNDAVAYTIHYEDAEGNTLAPSETYYGNVGDKPVIAYLYIEGYEPQAYNLTKTLDANAAENVFTFVYHSIGEGAGDGTGTPVQGAESEAETDGTGGTAESAENAGNAEGDATGDDAVDIPDAQVPQAGPVERQDLDIEDSEVPLGIFQPDSSIVSILGGNAFLLRIPAPVKACVLIVLLGLVYLAVRRLMKSRKEKES